MSLAQLSFAAALATALSVPDARAVEDFFINVPVPYVNPQEADLNGRQYCLAPNIIQAQLGSRMASVVEAIFYPKFVLKLGNNPVLLSPIINDKTVAEFRRQYMNINALAGMPVGHVLDPNRNEIPDGRGVINEKLLIDLNTLNRLNGPSIDGRAQTVRKAKLVVMTLVNAAGIQYGAGNFRINIEFRGLPSQEGLAGERVSARPDFPYTAESPAVSAFQRELLAPRCP